MPDAWSSKSLCWKKTTSPGRLRADPSGGPEPAGGGRGGWWHAERYRPRRRLRAQQGRLHGDPHGAPTVLNRNRTRVGHGQVSKFVNKDYVIAIKDIAVIQDEELMRYCAIKYYDGRRVGVLSDSGETVCVYPRYIYAQAHPSRYLEQRPTSPTGPVEEQLKAAASTPYRGSFGGCSLSIWRTAQPTAGTTITGYGADFEPAECLQLRSLTRIQRPGRPEARRRALPHVAQNSASTSSCTMWANSFASENVNVSAASL